MNTLVIRNYAPLFYQKRFQSKNVATAFKDMINAQRKAAQCSFLIEDPSPPENNFHTHHEQIVRFCEKFGKIRKVFWYGADQFNNSKHMYLVRFCEPSSASALLQACPFILNDIDSIAFSMRHLVLRPYSKLPPTKKDELCYPTPFEKEVAHMDHDTFLKDTMSLSISEQLQALYEVGAPSEFDISLKFLTCLQVEELLQSFFPQAAVLPFGSTVNGFGRRQQYDNFNQQSDLDMLLAFNYKLSNSKQNRQSLLAHADLGISKSANWAVTKDFVMKVAELFKLNAAFLNPRYVLARVSIVKFKTRGPPVMDCDLSMANVSGLHMSELLYLMGELDSRVRPLVFIIRSWAKAYCLTQFGMSQKPSSFMLTVMCLFFLQSVKPAVLPPLKDILVERFQYLGNLDVLPNLNIIRKNISWQPSPPNTDSLEELVVKFFQFYTEFFLQEDRALCILHGKALSKPEPYPLYMYNPLDYHLNVSRNVSRKEFARFSQKIAEDGKFLTHASQSQNNRDFLSRLLNKNFLEKEIENVKSSKNSSHFNVSTIFDDDVLVHQKH